MNKTIHRGEGEGEEEAGQGVELTGGIVIAAVEGAEIMTTILIQVIIVHLLIKR